MKPYTPMNKWRIAQSRDNHASQKSINVSVEVQYHAILTKVKMLLGKSAHPVFERDFKRDHSYGAEVMHSFISSSFYWHLTCDMFYYYCIEYAFYTCSFEAEVKAMLRGHTFNARAKEVQLKPDFNTFYKNVLKVQDSRFISF